MAMHRDLMTKGPFLARISFGKQAAIHVRNRQLRRVRQFCLVMVAFFFGCAPTLAGDPIRARCHMNECSWFRILEMDWSKLNGDGFLIDATTAVGTSKHQNGDYNKKAPIIWERPKHSFYFCSKTRPAAIFAVDGTKNWYVHLLAPGTPATSGYNYSSTIEYLAVCHAIIVAHPGDQSIARRFGYSSGLADKAEQIELAAPAEILDGALVESKRAN